jgi:histidinol-phosphate aminotransferase
MSIENLIRKNIRELKPYSTARDEFKGQAEVYLDANENPFPTPYHRYPDPLQKKLKQRISQIKGIAPEQIFLGNGSDEAIDLLIRVFCEPGKDSILIAEPTYGMYSVCAGVNNVTVKKAMLTQDFDVDAEAVQSNLETVKLIFLCSPNNPSGNLLSKASIRKILTTRKAMVVIDEAYIDFAADAGFLPELAAWPNLVVLQTLSKAWGLAGLRLGMAFASQEIIQVLNKIKYPYNISVAAQQLALEQLDSSRKDEQVGIILEERTTLVDALKQFHFIKHIYPSDANFILVKTKNAKAIYDYLIAQSIIVRDRSNVVLCEGCLRITVGTPEENSVLIEKLSQFQ